VLENEGVEKKDGFWSIMEGEWRYEGMARTGYVRV